MENRPDKIETLFEELIGMLVKQYIECQLGLSNTWSDKTECEFLDGNVYVYIPGGIEDVFTFNCLMEMAADPLICDDAVEDFARIVAYLYVNRLINKKEENYDED